MNSLVIALNVLKRLSKQTTLIVFLLVFPLIAATLGMIMGAQPEVLEVGIVLDSTITDVYEAFLPLEEYNFVPVTSEELTAGIADDTLAMGIKATSDGDYIYEIVSKSGGDAVNSLKNQLLYFNENGSVYSITSHDSSRASTMAIGMYLLFMIMFVGNCSLILLDDRRERTYMRLFCLPISTVTIVAGYMIALFIAGTLQIVWFLFLLTIVLKVDLAVSLITLLLLLTAFLITTIGLAIGLTSLIISKEKYNVALPVIALFTTFLSGSLIPIDIFGQGIKYISYLVPQRWVVNAMELIRAGGDFNTILPHIGVLLLFALVFFTFGTKVLNKETL